MPDQHSDNDTTRATARLPGLDIEVVHRRSPEAEQISIHLQALPSFDAFGRWFDNANPFAFWAEATRLMWWPLLPWLGAAQVLLPPGPLSDPSQQPPEA